MLCKYQPSLKHWKLYVIQKPKTFQHSSNLIIPNIWRILFLLVQRRSFKEFPLIITAFFVWWNHVTFRCVITRNLSVSGLPPPPPIYILLICNSWLCHAVLPSATLRALITFSNLILLDLNQCVGSGFMDSGVLMTKNWKNYSWKKIYIFLYQKLQFTYP